MPRMKSSFLVTAPLLAVATFGSACVVSVDSQGQIVRDEKRFTVDGHSRAAPDDLRRGDRDSGRGTSPTLPIEIEKRGPTREAVDELEVKSSQDGNRIELEVKRPAPSRSAASGSISRPARKLIVSVPRDVQRRGAQRRRLDHDRARQRPARAADRRRQHPGVGRRRRADAQHRRRLGHGRRRPRATSTSTPATAASTSTGKLTRGQAAHRRRLDRLPRRSRRAR